MFILNFFFWGGGTLTPIVMCANKPWRISSACENLRGQHPLRAGIQSPEQSPLGRVDVNAYNFFHLWTKVRQIFFRPIGECLWFIKQLSDFRCVDPFRRNSRSKSKVVKSRTEFWTFFALPNSVGDGPSKISVHVITTATSHIPW